MPDSTKNIFGRMNLQQLRSFLLYGTDDYADETRPYSEKLKTDCDPIHKRLENIYPDGPERDEAAADLSQALTAYEYIYMELGMKAGARLIYQLLLTDDQSPRDDNTNEKRGEE